MLNMTAARQGLRDIVLGFSKKCPSTTKEAAQVRCDVSIATIPHAMPVSACDVTVTPDVIPCEAAMLVHTLLQVRSIFSPANDRWFVSFHAKLHHLLSTSGEIAIKV